MWEATKINYGRALDSGVKSQNRPEHCLCCARYVVMLLTATTPQQPLVTVHITRQL